jgi:hypothetical protein
VICLDRNGVSRFNALLKSDVESMLRLDCEDLRKPPLIALQKRVRSG